MITEKQKKQLEKELGNFARLDRAETSRQRLYRACVAYWEKLYPERVINWDKDMQEYRAKQANEFATMDTKAIDMRHLFSLPGNRSSEGVNSMGMLDLMEEIFRIFENNPGMEDEVRPLSQQEERIWFWKQYPRYRVSEKI